MKPHLSREAVEQATAEIFLMPFFPGSDIESRAIVLRYFFDICNSDDQALWLGKRYVTLFSKWAGLRELRAVACSKFKPRDGVEVYSDTYLEGIPSEKPLAGPLLIPSPKSREISADPDMRQLVGDIAAAVTLPAPPKPRTVAEIEAELYKPVEPKK